MNKIPFQKFHGFGNDYIVVTRKDIAGVSDISEFSRALCHRNTGAGSDGIALLEKCDIPEADYSCRIINPDGSEAGFSGNGTRCAVAYLYREGFWTESTLRLKTKSGIKTYEYLKREGDAFWYLAELGLPEFDHAMIPFELKAGASDLVEFNKSDLVFGQSGDRFDYLALNVGNPVCAVFVDDFELDWLALGASIENHGAFPERTNVVFVKPVDKKQIEIRIFERGAGETLSSGTCSVAAAVASAKTGRAERKLEVHAEGGMTEAFWREDGEMLITGSAEYIYSGIWPTSGDR